MLKTTVWSTRLIYYIILHTAFCEVYDKYSAYRYHDYITVLCDEIRAYEISLSGGAQLPFLA